MNSNSSGMSHLLVVLFASLLILPVTAITIQSISTSSDQKGMVLKDSDDSGDSDNSGSGSSDSGKQEDNSGSDSSDDKNRDSDEVEDEVEDDVEDEEEVSDDSVSFKIEDHNDDDENEGKMRAEVRLSETEKIKVRTKDGERRIDVYQGGVKVRFEYKDGKFVAKAEYEGSDEGGSEIEEDEIVKIIDDLESSDLKISTRSGRLSLSRGNVNAVTDFPLSIDVDKNNLIVNTPAGERIVSVLPDEAVSNLLTTNTISRVVNSDKIEIGEINTEPVYEIDGISDQKLLGFIPVEIHKSIDVSAQTGNIVEISQNFLSKIIDVLSS